MRQIGIWIVIGAGVCLAPRVVAQEWTTEELEQRVRGFLEPGTPARLAQIGALVAEQDAAATAVAARIHGNHREYLLKVQRLIDSLTDERWAERERAERTLIEVGARGRALLDERRRSGELLEERIRCERILHSIDARGSEREQDEIAILRGLVETAIYLRGSPPLRRALLSALGHTDPEVRRSAARALGRHGSGADALALLPLLDAGADSRRLALVSIAGMPGTEALDLCSGWLDSGDLTASETAMVARVVRHRPDAAPLRKRWSEQADPLLAAAARVRLPPAGANLPATVTFADDSEIRETFWGMRGDTFTLSSPVSGIDVVEVPFAQCRQLEFQPARSVLAGDVCRVFLSQGSLVLGTQLELQGDTLRFESEVFGKIEAPRSLVQGIAVDPQVDRLIGASTSADRVRSRSQETIEGRCLQIAAGEVVMLTDDASQGSVASQRMALADVAGILFERPLQSTSSADLFTRVDLVSGDRLLGHLLDIDASHLALFVPEIGTAVVAMNDVARLEVEVAGGALWGFTLIADYSDNKIVELDEQGNEVFTMEEVYGAWDVECLESGNLLITEFSVSRVQEVTRAGETVWSFEDLRNPYDADRLPDGNTLIADTFAHRVIEVTPDKQIVWEYGQGVRPFDVDRLSNGNTLIADVLKERVIEVSPGGKVVWEFKNARSVHDADRLPNGNTLITLRSPNVVIEVDPSGAEVFRLSDLNAPSDADRLPNGNTIVAENNMVREFDRRGQVVWKKQMTWAVEVNRY